MSDTPPIFPPPTFPLEIAEHVIDCVGSGHQAYRTLMTCALTCKAWLPRSRARLYSAVVIRRQFQLIQFSRSLAYRPLLSPLVKEFIVLWKRGWQKSTLQCLISFPDQLACRLPNLRQLKIFSTLTASPLSFYGPHFFLSIGEFRSMTTLVLSTIVFQSFSNFGRLLLALPTITSLDCYRLQWKRLGADPFRFRRRDEPMSLRSLVVEGMEITDLSRLLSGKGRNLQTLHLDYAPEHAYTSTDMDKALAKFPCLPLMEELTISLTLQSANEIWPVSLMYKLMSSRIRVLTIEYCDPWVTSVAFSDVHCSNLDNMLEESRYPSLEKVRLVVRAGGRELSGSEIRSEIAQRLPNLVNRRVVQMEELCYRRRDCPLSYRNRSNGRH